jgi:subtilisin family serine protease
VVGLKAPGQPRGVWKDKVLVNDSQWREAREAILARPGVTLLAADSLLPIITIELDNVAVMQAIRTLPVVDYLEPRFFPVTLLSDGSLDCKQEPWDFNMQPSFTDIGNGNLIPWNYGHSHIQEAWARGGATPIAGAGITIGLLDTGIFDEQTLFHQPLFSSGMSVGRTIQKGGFWTYDPGDRCGHGTRMAGTIAAPLLGVRAERNIVGVAWQANLAYTRRADGVVLQQWEESTTSNGILELAADFWPGMEADIITMAWGSPFWFESIADRIRSWYYKPGRDMLFIAAAGTPAIAGTPCGVVFPARMEEVIAVAGATPDGHLSVQSCGGPEVDIAAVVGPDVPSTGRRPGDIWKFGGSSDASAIVSGIAALIWSHYPDWNRDQVRARLYSGADRRLGDPTLGAGIANAYKSVGGFTGVSITGPATVPPHSSYTLTAQPSGDGPFTYTWTPGGNTTPSIQGMSGVLRSRQTWTVVVRDLLEGKSISQSYVVSTSWEETSWEE